MLSQIQGLHHVTSLASGAQRNNAFFTRTLGLRRVKKTVNFDRPDVYHLYYGDEIGTPGTVMTYFPFPNATRRTPGSGEVSTTAFSVPKGSLPFWEERLAGRTPSLREGRFGEARLRFDGPDRDDLTLVETEDDRTPWTESGIDADTAIRGFHSVELALSDIAPTAELLRFMGYEEAGTDGAVTRFSMPNGNGANFVDLLQSDAPEAGQGAGSVHHVAFAVADRAAQKEVQQALEGEGFQVTEQIDRDYFWAIYFRSPGGVLFEVATGEPGFDRDEERGALGEALKLPDQHAHLRERLEATLEPISD